MTGLLKEHNNNETRESESPVNEKRGKVADREVAYPKEAKRHHRLVYGRLAPQERTKSEQPEN